MRDSEIPSLKNRASGHLLMFVPPPFPWRGDAASQSLRFQQGSDGNPGMPIKARGDMNCPSRGRWKLYYHDRTKATSNCEVGGKGTQFRSVFPFLGDLRLRKLRPTTIPPPHE